MPKSLLIPLAKKPQVYIAGKISHADFREELIPGLWQHQWGNPYLETDSFIYLGPYTVNCAHGCFSGAASHGCIGEDGARTVTAKDVIETNMEAIRKADIVIAYINATDCFGTMFEIGWALRAGKRVVMCMSPTVPANEFWFSSNQVASVYYDVNTCCLKQILQNEIRNYGKN